MLTISCIWDIVKEAVEYINVENHLAQSQLPKLIYTNYLTECKQNIAFYMLDMSVTIQQKDVQCFKLVMMLCSSFWCVTAVRLESSYVTPFSI